MSDLFGNSTESDDPIKRGAPKQHRDNCDVCWNKHRCYNNPRSVVHGWCVDYTGEAHNRERLKG